MRSVGKEDKQATQKPENTAGPEADEEVKWFAFPYATSSPSPVCLTALACRTEDSPSSLDSGAFLVEQHLFAFF